MKKLSYVDSLRGYAILLVVLVHTSQGVAGLPGWLFDISTYGKYGVQLFFIMSAYTLCLSWKSRQHESRNTIKYYLRRYFRIAPLYYVGMLVYGLVVLLKSRTGINTFGLNPDYSPVKVAAGLTFTNSLSSYTVHSGVPGGWSIGTEMMFYLIFPLLYGFFLKVLKPRPGLMLAVPVMLMVITAVFFRSLPHLFPPLSAHNFEFYYCTLINQLPVFLIGMVFFFYPSDFKFGKVVALSSFLLFFAVAALVTFLKYKNINDITATVFLTGISFVFLIIAVKNLDFLNSAFIQMIGRLSFSIYIFHFIFAWLLAPYLNQLLGGSLNSYMMLLVALCVTVAGSVAISSATKYLIEDRGIELGRSIIKRIK